MATASDEFLVRFRYWLRQRRNDHAERLRNDDKPQRRSGTQTERARRLRLSVADGQNSRPHDLGDERRRVDGKREEEREEFRLHLHAAAQAEARLLGELQTERHPKREVDDERQPDHGREVDPDDRQAAGRSEAACGRPRCRPRSRSATATRKRDPDPPRARMIEQSRHEGAAVGKADPDPGIDRIARIGQHRDDAEIPEQDDEKRRDVAEHLDIDRAQLADQPVHREPPDADQESDDRRRNDAEPGDDQRVQEADEERVAVGAVRRVGDRRLADLEPGARSQGNRSRRRCGRAAGSAPCCG